MSSHSVHSDIQTHGLADNCERCEEQAESPWRYLGDEALRDLVERATSPQRFEYMRSHVEGVAMAKVIDAIDHVGRLLQAAPEAVVDDLVKRWGAPINYTG